MVAQAQALHLVDHQALVQHQAQAQEGIENRTLGLIKPSSDGLADCKTTTRDANLVLGLYSPFKYEIRTHEGYDITKFRNYIRFLQVIEDRDYGASGQVCPLFFNGMSSMFRELPKPNEPEIDDVISFISRLDSKKQSNKVFFLYMVNVIKKLVKKVS